MDAVYPVNDLQLVALGLTLAVEVPGMLLLSLAFGYPAERAVWHAGVAAGVNLVSHTLFSAALPLLSALPLPWLAALGAAEVAVALAESVAYWAACRLRRREALIAGFALNVASLVVGEWAWAALLG